MRKLNILAALAAFAASGCVSASNPGDGLAETAWRIVTIDGASAASTGARIAFDDDRLSATVGCNGLGGNWRLDQGRLIAGPLVGTKMFCEGRLDEQERALAALLVSSPEVVMDEERLELRSSGHSAQLLRER